MLESLRQENRAMAKINQKTELKSLKTSEKLREQKAIPRYQPDPEEQKKNQFLKSKMDQMKSDHEVQLKKITQLKNANNKEKEDKAKMTELYVTKMQEMEAKIKALENKKNEPDPRQLEEMKRLKT